MYDKRIPDATPETAAQARVLVVLGNRILANEGVNDGYGHVTIRNPENPQTFFMSASVSPEFVNLDDILEIGVDDAAVLTRTDKQPYGERFIHSEVFRLRPDVMAISHNHAPAAIVLSVVDVPVRPVSHMAGMFWAGVPYYDEYDTPNGTLGNTRAEGERIARRLGDKRACIMRGHGAVVVGESIAHCVMSAVALRDNCLAQAQAMLLSPGSIRAHPEDLAKAAMLKNFAANPLARGWAYWVNRARRAMPDIADL